jgi:hypothetical protein
MQLKSTTNTGDIVKFRRERSENFLFIVFKLELINGKLAMK